MLLPTRWPPYFRSVLITSIGGLLFGMDTGTIGPVTTMPSYTASFGSLSSTLHGVVVSSILVGGMLSGIVSGNIADAYGRGPVITAGSCVFCLGATLEAAAQTLGMFIAGRVVGGLGMGLFLGTLTVYVCEIVPAKRRGPLASLIQFLLVSGIVTGYFIAYGTARIERSSASWRIPLAIQALVAAVFAALSLTLPPSPRWLLVKHRPSDAKLVLERLGLDTSELSSTLTPGTDHIPADLPLLESIRKNFQDMGRLFHRGARKQTGLACFLMAMQQWSGIDGVLYYAPLLFQQAGLASAQASFLASGVSALVMLAVTIPASIYTDKFGRRGSIVSGGIAMTIVMLLMGSLYAADVVHGGRGAARWVAIVCIYLFAIAYSMTWAISMRIYSSEIQPAATRASATTLAQSANWLANFTVALTTPILLSRSSFAIYFLFGGCIFLTVLACIFLMPETKGRSLESIERGFSSGSPGLVEAGEERGDSGEGGSVSRDTGGQAEKRGVWGGGRTGKAGECWLKRENEAEERSR